jgi:membrane protease YdiL (CAAX protease family)
VLPTPDPAPDQIPDRLPGWGFGDVAITLGLTLVLGTIVALVVRALVDGAWSSQTGRAWASLLLLVVPWLALAGWPIFASRTRGNGPVRDFGLTASWSQAAVGFVGGVLALLLGSFVAAVQEKITGHQISSAVGELAQNTTSASAAALAILALCTVLGAPVVEEIAFRGLTFGAFRKMGQPVVWSVVWTTLMFALFHFELQRVLVLLVIGGCLGWVRAQTGSTAASMVTHMTVNLPGAIAILALGHGG